MRERKLKELKEQFSTVAERLRNVQSVDQLAVLQSIQYFRPHIREHQGCAKRRVILIGAVILLFIVICLTLAPQSQLTSDLLDVSGLLVIYFSCLY